MSALHKGWARKPLEESAVTLTFIKIILITLALIIGILFFGRFLF
ncbi:MAG: hypothetical protein ACJ754_00290 [Pyrinomonadaceae bacterium]